MGEYKWQAQNTADKWQDKSTFICRFCMYYGKKSETIGRCKRNAPTHDGWPAVYPSDWCGQHKISSSSLDGLLVSSSTKQLTLQEVLHGCISIAEKV